MLPLFNFDSGMLNSFDYKLITKRVNVIVTVKKSGVNMDEASAVGENIILFLVILGIVGIILTRKKEK
jgi:hypothetical protein